MHTTTLPAVANNLKNVLGDHLINRNVLLGNSINTTKDTFSYIWTTSYCTLMSGCQLTGKIGEYWNSYDDGEANYKLPLFDYTTFRITTSTYWIRGRYYNSINGIGYHTFYSFKEGGPIEIGAGPCENSNIGVRPMIYIR